MDHFGLSDGAALVLVLMLLYLMESVRWAPEGTRTFIDYWGGGWRVPRCGPWLANGRGACFFLGPLPSSTALVCQPWPFCIAPQGIAFPSSTSHDSGVGTGEAAVFYGWDEVTSITTQGNQLHIHGAACVKACTPETAEGWRELLLQVQRASAHNRERTIHELLRASLRVDVLERRLWHWKRHAPLVWLPGTGMLLAALTGGGSLLLAPHFPIPGLGRAAAAAFLFLWGVTLVAYGRVVMRRRGERYADRRSWQVLATMCLSPAAAMRANDRIARTIAPRFQPLAVGRVACSDNDFQELARQTLRALHFPLRGDGSVQRGMARAVQDWFRNQSIQEVERFLRSVELSPVELLRPPTPQPDALSYCPRCEMQFTLPGGVCASCPGVMLQVFAAASKGAVAVVTRCLSACDDDQ